MWEEFDFGGQRWTRCVVGAFEAQIRLDDATRSFRVIEIPTRTVLLYGVSALSEERTKVAMNGMLITVSARRTSEIKALI